MNTKLIAKLIFVASALLLVNSACDLVEQDGYKEQYIVEAYLIANRPMPDVYLTTDVKSTTHYAFEDVTVDGAEVNIHRLDESGGIADSYAYQAKSSGIYEYAGPEKVDGGATYRLEITIPHDQNHRIISETTVPTHFEIQEIQHDSTAYQGGIQPSALISPSSYKDRQAYYVLTIEALDPKVETFTPVYADIWENQMDDAEFEDFVKVNSGIINEEGMERFVDGRVKIDMPWSAIVFYGYSEVVFSTVGDNYADFALTQDLQEMGGNVSPGEMYNLRYNIDGAVGVFGSFASDTASVFVYPNE